MERLGRLWDTRRAHAELSRDRGHESRYFYVGAALQSVGGHHVRLGRPQNQIRVRGNRLRNYVLRRLAVSIPVLFGISVMLFIVAHAMPGDFGSAIMPPDMVPGGGGIHISAYMRERYGLDKPLSVQYFYWLKEIASGNLGYSYATAEPVLDHIKDKMPATLELTVTSLLFSLITGTTLGIISALKQYSWLDHLLTGLGFVWVSTPVFVFALLSLYLFYFKIPLFPLGMAGPIEEESVSLWTRLHYLFLPATILGLEGVASFMRYTRGSLLEVLGQPYVAAARAKGLREKGVILGHALRNALIPLVTLLGLKLPGVLGGTFILEMIFTWPGMGRYALIAITRRDYPVIMGVNMLVAVFVLLCNLAVDITYAVIDPRIRYT